MSDEIVFRFDRKMFGVKTTDHLSDYSGTLETEIITGKT